MDFYSIKPNLENTEVTNTITRHEFHVLERHDDASQENIDSKLDISENVVLKYDWTQEELKNEIDNSINNFTSIRPEKFNINSLKIVDPDCQFTGSGFITAKKGALKTQQHESIDELDITENEVLKYDCEQKELKNEIADSIKKCTSIKPEKYNFLPLIIVDLDEHYRCPDTDFTTTEKRVLKTHQQAHIKEISYSKYVTKSTLKAGPSTRTGKKTLQCSRCDYKCYKLSRLKVHESVHTNENPFQCFDCNYKSTIKQRLIEHTRTHIDEKPFQCYDCGYKSRTKQNLLDHILAHSGTLLQCSICDYKCTEKISLTQHERIHTGEMLYQCFDCGYMSGNRYTFIQHTRMHTGEKLFKCSVCDYKSPWKNHFADHLRTHTGEKPFHCTTCDYKCAQKSTLRVHMRTHSGEKPFHCTTCDYKCALKTSLKKHMQTHSGEKRFQ